jgi:hypothetical protein
LKRVGESAKLSLMSVEQIKTAIERLSFEERAPNWRRGSMGGKSTTGTNR